MIVINGVVFFGADLSRTDRDANSWRPANGSEQEESSPGVVAEKGQVHGKRPRVPESAGSSSEDCPRRSRPGAPRTGFGEEGPA